jgi:hypothetical protein
VDAFDYFSGLAPQATTRERDVRAAHEAMSALNADCGAPADLWPLMRRDVEALRSAS